MDPAQIEQLIAAFDGLSEIMAQIREANPVDAAVEQEEGVEEATMEEEEAGETEEPLAPANDKQVKKNAAVAMLKRSL